MKKKVNNARKISPVKKQPAKSDETAGRSKSKKKADPKRQSQPFPIVAIGASAGGLEAITELLRNLSKETGMAYVYLQHLDPTHESMLSAILGKATQMKVVEAQDKMFIEANHVYVLPPNKEMYILDGVLKLNVRPAKPILSMPIDHFFRSLAEKQKEGAIGIVLSGNASDGALGLKAIKSAGGLTFAQDDTAKFQSMPKSAVAEGAVDMILSPKEIALELERLSSQPHVLKTILTPEDEDDDTGEVSKQDYNNILILLKKSTGVDFSHYKKTTIKRRIIRRMLLYKLKDLKEYAEHLKQHAAEVATLYQDLLINVTTFFRDVESTDYLKKIILPKIIKSKQSTDPIRIWVAACSTGEEAYSLAMLLMEVLGERAATVPVQIFATDLSEIAIAKARIGIYSKADVAEISPRRMQRFFTRIDGSYRIVKSIRDMCVFAPHNVFKDPPFSRLDIVSCCNLLIYLDVVLQRKVIATLHYALQPSGFLVLGKSETVGTATNLFTLLDKKTRVYQRKKDTSAKAIFEMNYRIPEPEKFSFSRPLKKEISAEEQPADVEKTVDNILLNRYVPACVLVNKDLDILQFRGSSSLFLEPAPGKASLNLLKMARGGLSFELRNAIHKVNRSGEHFKKTGIEIKYKNNIHQVSIEVLPVKSEQEEKHYLVVFEEEKVSPANASSLTSRDKRVSQLEQELQAAKEDMRLIVEEQEAVNEELQSANEEIVSSNEELQSINEELETSKEEVESSNEELMTINSEIQVRSDQLAESYEYAESIIATIRESAIVLDPELRIKSANKAFYKTFHLNVNDTEGRVIYELAGGEWNIPKLRELLEEILPNNNQFFGFEIQHVFSDIGEKVMMVNARRIVQKSHRQQFILLAIEDITEHAQSRRVIAEREQWFRNMANEAPVMIWTAGTDKLRNFFNQTWLQFTGKKMEEETGMGWVNNVHPDDREQWLRNYYTGFDKQQPYSYEYRLRRFDGIYRWMLVNAKPTFNVESKFSGFIGTVVDIHDKKMAEEVLRRTVEINTFRVKLVDAISTLSDPQQIESEAVRVLGEHLDVNRVLYTEPNEDRKTLTIKAAYVKGGDKFSGVLHLNDLESVSLAFSNGQTWNMPDTSASHDNGKLERRLLLSLGVSAVLAVPVIKEHRWIASVMMLHDTPRNWTETDNLLLEETAERTWIALERTRAAVSLRVSEEKYRTLFNSISEGFLLGEIMRDEKGNSRDYRVLEINPAFEEMMAVSAKAVVGKSLHELLPNNGPWLEAAANASQRQGIRVEQHIASLNKWFEIHFSSSDVRGDGKFLAVFTDITRRKRREANLGFLAAFSQEIISLSSAPGLVHALGERLHRFMQATVCVFIEINEESNRAVINNEWHQRGVPPLAGHYDLREFVTDEFLKTMSAGVATVIRDTSRDLRIKDPSKFSALGIGAFINVPLVRNGKWRFALGIYHDHSYAWRDDEISLMLEVAERIWYKWEQIRAEEALRENKKRLELAIEVSSLGTFIWNVKEDRAESDPQMLALFGLPPDSTLSLSVAITKLIHEDDRQCYADAVAQSIDPEQGGKLREDIRVVYPDHSIHWVAITAQTFFSGNPPEAIYMAGVAADITDRKRAEESLRESENRIRTILESLPQIAYTSGPQGEATYFNSPFYEFTGKDRNEPLSENFKYLHPDDRETTAARWKQSLETGMIYEHKTRYRRKDGTYRWHLARVAPVKNSSGEIMLWAGTSTDIHNEVTMREEIENLLSSEKFLRAQTEAERQKMYDVFMSAPASIAISEGKDHRIIFANNTYLSILGKQREEVIGKVMKEAIPEVDPQYIQLFDGVFNDGQEFQAIESLVELKRNGKPFHGYFDYTLRPIRNSSGGIEGVIGFGIEVTDQVKARKVVEESAGQIRTILEGLPQMAWMTDPSGKILFANKEVGENDDFGSGDFLSDKSILHSHDENAGKIWKQHLKEKSAFELQLRFKEKTSGNYRWFLIRSNPVKDAAGRVTAWIATATDIHDQKMFAAELELRVKKRTEELKEANLNLKRSNTELEHFAFVASHDLQEPLRKIQTFIQRLQRTYRESLPEPSIPYFDKIGMEADRMTHLIDDVLSFSRVGTSNEVIEQVDLSDVFKDALRDFEVKQAEMNATISAAPLPVISAVPFQMRQLFHNLLSNAFKFASTERPLKIVLKTKKLSQEELKKYPELISNHTYHEIHFSDNGIGFHQKFADKVFVIFQRLHSTQEYPGTGIGLALCKKIADHHGGLITVTSSENKGTSFTIILPESNEPAT